MDSNLKKKSNKVDFSSDENRHDAKSKRRNSWDPNEK